MVQNNSENIHDSLVTVDISEKCLKIYQKMSLINPLIHLPEWKPGNTSLAGTIVSVGSNSLNNMMTLWAFKFQEHYPSVEFQIEGNGGSTTMPPIIAGSFIMGPLAASLSV